MATYWQWRSKHPEHKLLYYLCGEELPIRLEVQDAVIRQWTDGGAILVPVKYNEGFATMESGVLTETQQSKIILLMDIDKLKEEQQAQIEMWAWRISKGLMPQTILIISTGEVNPDTSKSLYRPFVEKGRFVECKAMTVDNMKRYAMEDYKLTETAADLLLELVSYNFTRVNNELEKIACLDLSVVDEKVVRELVVFSADDLFVMYMLHRNNLALKVVSAVSSSSILRVINLLTVKLAFLHQVIVNDTGGVNAHKLAAILNVQPWQLLEYFAYKRFWTGAMVLDKLKLLTVIEEQYAACSSNVLALLASWW